MISVTGFLLDTSIIIAHLKDELSEEARRVISSSETFISIITFIETCRYWHQAGKARQWEKAKDGLTRFKILGIGTTTGEIAAGVAAKDGLSLADSIIYATAVSNGLTLATLDNDFRNKKGTIVLGK